MGDFHRKNDVVSRWVSFTLDGQNYAIPIVQVVEVIAQAEIEPVPGAPSDVLGVINLRGTIVTVIDLRLHFSLPVVAPDENTRIIVVERGNESIGLRVDRVSHVRSIPQHVIQPAPKTSQTSGVNGISGVVTRPEGLLSLLDPGLMLAA